MEVLLWRYVLNVVHTLDYLQFLQVGVRIAQKVPCHLHIKNANGKTLLQEYPCNMPRNMTANNKVNVNCYYTLYKKIKFINVGTVPFCLYKHFSKNRCIKVICFIVFNMCCLKMFSAKGIQDAYFFM
jgi:hypothetical protein